MRNYKKQNISFLKKAIKVYNSHKKLGTDIPDEFKDILYQLSYDKSKLVITKSEAIRLLNLIEEKKV